VNTSRRAREMMVHGLLLKRDRLPAINVLSTRRSSPPKPVAFDPHFRPRARDGLVTGEIANDLQMAASVSERRTSLAIWQDQMPDTQSQLEQASDYAYDPESPAPTSTATSTSQVDHLKRLC
jgi:hypothetical protein